MEQKIEMEKTNKKKQKAKQEQTSIVRPETTCTKICSRVLHQHAQRLKGMHDICARVNTSSMRLKSSCFNSLW